MTLSARDEIDYFVVSALHLFVVRASARILASAKEYGLHVLEHMPYRPPDDMSTMLGGEELAAVRGLIVVFAAVWCAAFVAFIAVCWPRRRAS